MQAQLQAALCRAFAKRDSNSGSGLNHINGTPPGRAGNDDHETIQQGTCTGGTNSLKVVQGAQDPDQVG